MCNRRVFKATGKGMQADDLTYFFTISFCK